MVAIIWMDDTRIFRIDFREEVFKITAVCLGQRGVGMITLEEINLVLQIIRTIILGCCAKQTDVRVILTGEISDELFGYKYTDFAPNAEAFQAEAVKRVSELYMYDVLRADRCISVNSLEARVPFGDLDFVRYVMSIDPEMMLNRYNKGKYALYWRPAFYRYMGS